MPSPSATASGALERLHQRLHPLLSWLLLTLLRLTLFKTAYTHILRPLIAGHNPRIRRFACTFGLLLAVNLLHIASSPYTKVEESFTIQAVHDILAHGTFSASLPHYDHQRFPGAVPRSFIGPLLLASPILGLFHLTNAFRHLVLAQNHISVSPAGLQVWVRALLAATSSAALAAFADALFPLALAGHRHPPSRKSIEHSATPFFFFVLLTASQFHANFWLGRTVPNSIVFPFVIYALSLLVRLSRAGPKQLRRKQCEARLSLALLIFASSVLRLEVVGLLAPAAVWLLLTRRLQLFDLVLTSVVAGLASVVATTVVDTYFWQDATALASSGGPRPILEAFKHSLDRLVRFEGRPMWPELEAMVFNVVEGKSSEWGVSPWHAYFTEHLTKLLSFSLPLLAVGLVVLFGRAGARHNYPQRTVLTVLPLVHVATLSLLGHKEWRFVVYCLPCFNAVSAIGAARCWRGRSAALQALPVVVVLLSVAGTLMASLASHFNYPGGEALARLHRELDGGAKAGAAAAERAAGNRTQAVVRLHIDVLPAMTGVTLFQSLHVQRNTGPLSPFSQGTSDGSWLYDKTENLATYGVEAASAWRGYTHLLTEHRDCRVLYEVPELELPALSSGREEEKDASVGEREKRPLREEEQPFRKLVEPQQGYVRLRRKRAAQVARDWREAAMRVVQGRVESGRQMVLLLAPLEVVREDKVWICVNKALDS
ncbi:Dol-P-Man:Man(7)GlcNAc(2)-PP-Dol alpha-1,6-mannosyltransferase [Thecaphora frezii]